MSLMLKLSKTFKSLKHLKVFPYLMSNRISSRNFSCFLDLPLQQLKNFDTIKNNTTSLRIAVNLTHNDVKCENHKQETTFLEVIIESLIIATRFILIITVVVTVMIIYFVTRLIKPQIFSNVLLKAIEFLGPTFMKLGQWATTRRDLLPEEICDSLSSLQRHTPAHSWLYTKHLLKATYGPNWRQLFVNLDEDSVIGSGCCAQVYKAWINQKARINAVENSVPRYIHGINLNTNKYISSHILSFYPDDDLRAAHLHLLVAEFFKFGYLVDFILRKINKEVKMNAVNSEMIENGSLCPVAVKILHPGIENHFRRDLAILRKLSVWLTWIIPSLRWLRLPYCINEFSHAIGNQMDMKLEAENLLKFLKNFSRSTTVTFPQPIISLTSTQILVESFHEGTPVSDYINSNDHYLQRQLAKIGTNAVLKMIFTDNFVHCDLHPGNIIVEKISSLPKCLMPFLNILPFRYIDRPRLVILDCGLVATLSDSCRQNLRDVFHSIAIADGALAGEYIMRHSTHMTPDPNGFKQAMADIVNRYLDSRFTLANVDFSGLLQEFYHALTRYQVQQDESFINVILSIIVIEGLGRSLDPTKDILKEVLLYISRDEITNSNN